MVRGTTPTFTFTLPDTVDLTTANNVYVTFAQRNGSTLTMSGDDITVSAQTVDVYLSQEQSLMFAKGNITAQINWTYADGQRACTNIVQIPVDANLLQEVLP
jgi:hypothetical protein